VHYSQPDPRLQGGSVIFGDATATVGRTPIVELRRIGAGLPGRLLAKLEMRNPGGSVKLHVALTLAADPRYAGMAIVVLLPDGGERYRSSPLFAANR
jgi:cysteine synthase